jgi:hypothetical protein
MRQLDAEPDRAPAAAQGDGTGQRHLVGIRIEAETAAADAARWLDRRLLDDQEAGARQRQRAQVLQVPVIG